MTEPSEAASPPESLKAEERDAPEMAKVEGSAEPPAAAPTDAGSTAAESTPAEAAIPAPVKAPEAPEPVKPRGSFWTGLVDFLRAAMFGASFAIVFLGVFILLDVERILDFDRNPVLGIGVTVIVPLALAVRRGFPVPARGLKRVLGRTLGVALLGVLLFGVQFVLLVEADKELRLNDRETSMLAVLGGLALFTVTWLRVRRARRKHAVPEVAPVVVERRGGPYLWAGGLAAGMLAWIIATLIAFEASDLLWFRLDYEGMLFFLLGLASVAFGASRGFSTELRRGMPFGTRFFMTLVCGLVAELGLSLVILPIGMIFEPSKLGMAALITVVAVALMGAALWRGRGVASEGRRGRVEVGVLGAALALLTLWPQSAWMRYALGSADGAQALATEHFEREDYARAATFAAVACERGDAGSCVMAAHIHRMGLGVPSSLQQAKRLVGRACRSSESCSELADGVELAGSRDLLFARACELGDRKACLRAQREPLNRRCKAGDAFGCRALADTFDDNPSHRSMLYSMACSLGDTSACPAKPPR